jgi:hypothetical protein
MPKSWQVEMDRQGWDPLDKTLPDVIDFIENIEAAEDHSRQSDTVAKKKSSSSNNDGKKDNNKSNSKKKPTNRFCKEHGPNFSHNTEECHTLACLQERQLFQVEEEELPQQNLGLQGQ